MNEVSEYRREWRDLSHDDRRKYATAMRRLNLGIWGHKVSTLRAVHLTTRKGDDNSSFKFARDLRKLVYGFRSEGYGLEYSGGLEYSPDNHLLHWHGIFRVKGGFFIKPMIGWEDKAKVRAMLGKRWNECHGAFVVQITDVGSEADLRVYILKHIMKEYIGSDEELRNKFLFSKGWMRQGWKRIEDLVKEWVLGGKEAEGGISAMFMTKDMWTKVNEVVEAWCKRETVIFFGEMSNGESSGYLSMELGRIREAFGSAYLIWRDGVVRKSRFEYIDF